MKRQNIKKSMNLNDRAASSVGPLNVTLRAREMSQVKEPLGI